MSRPRAGTVGAALLLACLVFLSLFPPRPFPPLGPVLDPVHGVWSAARQAELPREARAAVAGLQAPVTIRYDDRGVPHILAATGLDGIRALGYVVARDRQFQLELQARAGEGSLSGLLGPAALRFDREIRALGLADAARRRIAELPEADRLLLEAYRDGVNAWIDRTGRGGMPLEYHLLGRTPRRWETIHTLHLFNRMGLTLARSDLEEVQQRARAVLGPAAADALFPVNSPIQEPIQPNGQSAPRVESRRLPPPAGGGPPAAGNLKPAGSEPDAVGSNNWAVAPRRTAAGRTLLAGDPHLELTLPSIWYEVHLQVADSLDLYGVTIPGAPAVVIGFTRDLAWSATNTEADVFDLYRETVDDISSPARYRLDGEWRPLRIVIEPFYDPEGRLLAADTLRFTHRGPLRRDPESGEWRSLRWTVLEGQSGLAPFGQAARAQTAAGWLDSMSRYQAPAQNFLVADRQGHIGIRSTGRFPIRPGGRGDLVQPGGSRADDWSGDWPLAEQPQALDPAQGYLASANQQPVDPRVNSRYLGADWYSPWRALRINQLLRADSAVTPDAMRRFQTDPGSPAADLFVPPLVAAGLRPGASDSARRAAALLGEWDRRYTRENVRAVLYEETVRQLQVLLWDELGGADTPGLAVTGLLLPDSGNLWWDDRRTPEQVEDRDRLLDRALATGLGETVRRYGEPEAGGWRWDRIRQANIYHLLRIPSFSALGIPVQGGQSTLNPSSGRGGFGPSWRMVVELGDSVRAWGVYPGGQSGNPASSRYLDRLPQWRDGALDTLRFPRAAADLSGYESSRLILEPEGHR